MSVCIYVWTYVNIYLYMCLCMYKYIHIYIYINTETYPDGSVQGYSRGVDWGVFDELGLSVSLGVFGRGI